jgi:hypothetical protein
VPRAVYHLGVVEPHHAASIRNLVDAMAPDPSILGLVLVGSIAHGFARPDSDIDVAIVIDPADYQERRREGRLLYLNTSLCTYPGYIDGKYVDLEFLRQVADHGSDPARFAFEGSRILFSRVPELEAVLAEVTRFPVDQKRSRIDRFVGQLMAWRWYYGEATRLQNRYLRSLAVQKVVLFGSRIVLAENELLYPYHKWLLRVVEAAPRQPPGFAASTAALLAHDTEPRIRAFCAAVLEFSEIDWGAADAAWPTRYTADTELAWTTHEPPIDEL